MQTGGTGRSCTMNDFIDVEPETFNNSHYFLGILYNNVKADHGSS
jgi:hypothetical protein